MIPALNFPAPHGAQPLLAELLVAPDVVQTVHEDTAVAPSENFPSAQASQLT
jgi:hypothetical protein